MSKHSTYSDGITKPKRLRMERALWRLQRHDPTSPQIEVLAVKLHHSTINIDETERALALLGNTK